MILKNQIKKILQEETSLQRRVKDVIDVHGLRKGIKSVGGPENFKKIFNNDLSVVVDDLYPPYSHNLYDVGLSEEDRKTIFKIIFGDDINIENLNNGGDIYVYKDWNKLYYEDYSGNEWEYNEYDKNGFLSYTTDQSGKEVKMEHDENGLPTYIEWPTTREWERWEYDKDGNALRYETSWGTYKDYTKKDEVNESKKSGGSHYLRRRFDQERLDDEFREAMNYAEMGHKFESFDDLKHYVISVMMDGLHPDLSNSGTSDFPYDKIYEFLKEFYSDEMEKCDFLVEPPDMLMENTSLQTKLRGILENSGVEKAIKVVGGFNNFAKILDLDVNDIDTQEMLVKNFIYHCEFDGGESISFLEVKRTSSGGKKITMYFKSTYGLIENSSLWWIINEVSNYLSEKLFPFKVSPSGQPLFASRGVNIFLDAENVDNEEEDDQEEITEKWSQKYKKSINCNNPKGFSQKAHCAGKRKKNEIGEYSRTLKNTRQQGVGLRFPKSAIKANPSRFRPYNR